MARFLRTGPEMMLNRRDFLKKLAAASGFATLLSTPFSFFAEPVKESSLNVSIFSKHLHRLTIDRKVVFDAMKRDLNAVQVLWEKA